MNLNNRKNSTLIAVGVGALFIIVILASQIAQNPTQYISRMEQAREQKDLQFKNDPDSPIPREKRKTFEGLGYFVIQDIYRVEAQLIKDPKPDTLVLMGTKGEQTRDRLVRVGKLRFMLQDRPYELAAFDYLDKDEGIYFVPFYDLTTGVSTYGGGRYLEVEKGNDLIVDFNEAYNPYCVYNDSYLCPLPPRENKLNLEVRAGELDYRYAEQASSTPSP